MSDRWYDALATCETNSNWSHSTRSYTGGLGLYINTAARWSGRHRIGKLTPRQQVAIADRIAFKGWTNPKGEYVYPVGPYGWGCVKNTPLLKQLLCKSQNPLVAKKRRC